MVDNLLELYNGTSVQTYSFKMMKIQFKVLLFFLVISTKALFARKCQKLAY